MGFGGEDIFSKIFGRSYRKSSKSNRQTFYSSPNFGGFNYQDLFSNQPFTQTYKSQEKQGKDLQYDLFVTIEDVAKGAEKKVVYLLKGEKKEITVKIPPGIENGKKLRLAGKGEPGDAGQPPGDLYFKINLEKTATILMHSSEIAYIPEQFPGLVVKIKQPKTSALVFGSGKMVITGAKSEKESFEAAKKIIKEFKSKKILKNPKVEVKVQNIVASGDLFGEIDLERAAIELDFSMYEPEEFPGLIYQMKDPKVVILLFASGKIVCTGAKKEKEVYDAVEKLRKELEERGLITSSSGM